MPAHIKPADPKDVKVLIGVVNTKVKTLNSLNFGLTGLFRSNPLFGYHISIDSKIAESGLTVGHANHQIRRA